MAKVQQFQTTSKSRVILWYKAVKSVFHLFHASPFPPPWTATPESKCVVPLHSTEACSLKGGVMYCREVVVRACGPECGYGSMVVMVVMCRSTEGGQEAHVPSIMFYSMWLLLVLHTLGSDQQPYTSKVSLAARLLSTAKQGGHFSLQRQPPPPTPEVEMIRQLAFKAEPPKKKVRFSCELENRSSSSKLVCV